MRTLRPYIAICLSFVMLMTGHSMAGVRSANEPTMRVELCTGLTLATIYIDNDGNPTQAPHFCPDCMLIMLSAVYVPSEFARRINRFLPAQTIDIAPPAPIAHLAYLSRAPPALNLS